jgi:lysophospholipase L1-like esterase
VTLRAAAALPVLAATALLVPAGAAAAGQGGAAAAQPRAAASPARPAADLACTGRHWVGAWAASPSSAQGPGFADQSLRLVMRSTLGGSRVRIRLSNRFGSGPVTFSSATVARRAAGAGVVAGSLRRLRFDGRATVAIPAGGEVRSDPAALRVRRFGDLAISVHVRGASGLVSQHLVALQTSYAAVAGSGDRTADIGGGAYAQRLSSWPWLAGVEVSAPRRTAALVALGDSITEGFQSTADANARYPDGLARRLGASRRPLGVLNAGMSFNTTLRDFANPLGGRSALARLRPDVIAQPGVTGVVVLLGTNDLGLAPRAPTAAVITGLRRVVARLRAAGLRVVLGTLTPAARHAGGLHGTPEAIAARRRVNRWIRTGRAAHGVADFDAVLRDPRAPARLLPAYDSGDHLHPNEAGYRAMARAVPLGLLRGRCAVGAR